MDVLDLLAPRFWAKVNIAGEDECWLWIGAKGWHDWKSDYQIGLLYYYRRRLPAHRLAWQLAYGPIPPGICVLHSCDVPLCVNPNHLFLGTTADNTADRTKKGRTVGGRGEYNSHARVTAAEAKTIREMYAAGRSSRDLAALFGLRLISTQQIINGIHWRYAGGPIQNRRRGDNRRVAA